MAAAAGGRGAWAARTGSGPVRMRGDIFDAARRWRGRLLPTGHPASRAARRRRSGDGARREGCGGVTGGGVGVPRARPVAAGVRVDVIAPRAGGGGLCSWAASSSSVSTSRSFTPCSVFRAGGRRSVGWADVLLDVIGVGWKAPSVLYHGCPGTTTGVCQHWARGVSTGVDQRQCAPRINIGGPMCGANRAS